jgi:hypothetical protein
MDEQNQEQRKGLIRQAWFDRIALGAAAVLIYQALVVLGNSTSLTWLEEHVLPKWHWPNSAFDSVFIGFFGLIALILLLRSLGVGLKWSRNIWVPTLQVSVVWAMLLLLAGAWWQGDIGRVAALGCVLLVYIVICCISAFVLDWLRPNPVRDTSVATAKKLKNLSDQDFKDWLGDDAPTDRYDFCNRTPLVKRMYKRLDSSQTPGQRGQILFGDYGSGKSTVIKLLQQKLENNKKKRWLVVRFDTWGRSESPADITSMILDSILEAIRSSGVETISLLDASNRYIQAAFQIESRLSVLGILSARQSPEDILKEVNHILLLNNLRMLVIIEDADRCHDADKVIDTIAGFLDRIAHLSAFRFILTLKREAVKSDTALKLADFIEDIDSDANRQLLMRFFKFCKPQAGFVSPELRCSGSGDWPLINSCYNDIYPYLGNIRTTRLILKATLNCWNQVKQGAYFTDVFITQIIRHDKRLKHTTDISKKGADSGGYNERKIHLKLEEDKDSKPGHNTNELIKSLFDAPVTLSISEDRNTGSLLNMLSHRPAPRNSSGRLLVQRMAPDYWADILNSRLSRSNRIKEFFDALDLVSKNPDAPEQSVILDMMYCHQGLGPFTATKNFSDLFMAWGSPRFLARLITHFVKKEYRNTHAKEDVRYFKEKTALYLVDAMYRNFKLPGVISSDLESAIAAIEEMKKHVSDVDCLNGYLEIIKSGALSFLLHDESESADMNIFNVIIEKLRNLVKQDDVQ